MLDLLGDLVRLVEREAAREASGAATARCPAPTARRSTLCTSRTRRTPSAAACARSRTSASVAIGSTWTTTSASGSADSTRPLDRVGGGVPLADRGVDVDADDDVGELHALQPGASAAAAARRRDDAGDRQRAASSASAGTRSIEHVDVAAHQPHGGDEHEHATKSAAIESAFW